MAADETADEDTPRDQEWKDGDFANPATVRAALIEISSYAEEAIKANRRSAGEIKGLRKAAGDIFESQGQLLGLLAKIDRRSELTHALTEANSVRIGILARDAEVAHDKLHDLDKRVVAIRERNDRIDAEEAAERARIQAKIEHLKENVDDLERDVRDTQNRKIVSAEQATAALFGEVVRAKLTSHADIERETRADVRDERKHARDERSKTKWWVLGVAGAILLSIASAAIARATGQPPVPIVPLPTPTGQP